MHRHLLSASAAIAAATACLGLLSGTALAAPASPTSPVSVTARLRLDNALPVAHTLVEVPDRGLSVTGFVSHFVPREHVTLEVFLGRRRVGSHRLWIRAVRGGRGRFAAEVSSSRPGTLRLELVHRADPRMGALEARASIRVLSESTSDPLYVRLVQARLAALRFYLPQSGSWDLQTELAVTAYHRLLGRGTSATLDPATLAQLLDGHGSFAVRFPHQGRHVEGDLTDQLIALVDGAKVVAIYPISSGKPSTPTVLGSYQIYRRVPGYLPDGMYYSDFFTGGYAVHGYDPAPDYPASHGCMRLPISDAISVFDWLTLGDWVDVYGTPNESI